VLEERQIMRVGGGDVIDVDFRLVAATNKDLEKEIGEGRFREDLYYRLKVVTLAIPPLRERGEDVTRLAEHYLVEICREHGRDPKRFTREAISVLRAYPWPGNVRELRNVVESIVIFHRGTEIRAADLPAEILAYGPGVPYEIELPSSPVVDPVSAAGPAAAPAPLVAVEERSEGAAPGVAAAPRERDEPMTMADIEREAILSTLQKTGGRRVEAARLLDIGLRTLQRKLKEYKDQGRYEEPS
jgi:DNA-binding NtrC family response regulator